MGGGDPWQTGPPVDELGEFEVIARLRRRLGVPAPGVGGIALGMGDDAALLRPRPGFECALTCDIQVEGRHFCREWLSPEQLGTRAVEVSVSDIAAMGGVPRAAMISLGLPPDLPLGALLGIYDGIASALDRHQAAVAGGNVTASDTLFIDLAIVGEVEEGRALTRKGAAVGDLVFVTGVPGRAAVAVACLRKGTEPLDPGLRRAFTEPRARVDVGRYLVENGIAHAAIDLSDGLAGDLRHVCEESGVSIVLDAASLPRCREVETAADRLGVAAVDLVLGPSDDYELIFVTPPEHADRALASFTDGTVSPIGHVVSGPARVFLDEGADELRQLEGGWDHLR